MAKIVVYLNETQYRALLALSSSELRRPGAQIALIVREELEQRGLIKSEPTDISPQEIEMVHGR